MSHKVNHSQRYSRISHEPPMKNQMQVKPRYTPPPVNAIRFKPPALPNVPPKRVWSQHQLRVISGEAEQKSAPIVRHKQQRPDLEKFKESRVFRTYTKKSKPVGNQDLNDAIYSLKLMGYDGVNVFGKTFEQDIQEDGYLADISSDEVR